MDKRSGISKRKDRRGGLRSFLHLYNVDGRIQKEIDQFIAGYFRYNNAIKHKGAKRIMTIYLGLMALGAAVMALLVTGVCLLCR